MSLPSTERSRDTRGMSNKMQFKHFSCSVTLRTNFLCHSEGPKTDENLYSCRYSGCFQFGKSFAFGFQHFR